MSDISPPQKKKKKDEKKKREKLSGLNHRPYSLYAVFELLMNVFFYYYSTLEIVIMKKTAHSHILTEILIHIEEIHSYIPEKCESHKTYHI